MSLQRSAACCGVSFIAGSGEPVDSMYTSPEFGLSTLSCAVTPASLITLIKKSRVPASTNSGFAGPCSTFTRLSGLM